MINIIVSHYKHNTYLPDLLDSFFIQDDKNWILSLCNDDPDQDLSYILRDSRIDIQLAKTDKNLGQAFRFNNSIIISKHPWVGFMGADDIALAWKISSLNDAISAHNFLDVDVIYTDAIQLNANNQRLYIKSRKISEEIRERNFIVASTVVMRRDFLEENEIYFDEDLHYGEDWVLYNRLYEAGAKFVYLPWPTVYYRDYTSNIGIRYGPQWGEQKNKIKERINQIWKDEREERIKT